MLEEGLKTLNGINKEDTDNFFRLCGRDIMKTRFTISALVILLLIIPVLGQTEPKPTRKSTPSLFPLIDVLETANCSMNIYWSKFFEFPDRNAKPKSNLEAIEDFLKWLSKVPEKTPKGYEISLKEQEMGLKYANNIKMILEKLELIGSELSQFTYCDICSPISFAQKESQIVILVTGVASEKVFNTLRTTPKIRASKIVSSMILPSVKTFYNSFKNTDIKYFGMMVAYGCKDFSKDSILNVKPEVVSVVFSAKNCQNFAEGIITDDELMAASEIYLSDREMRGCDMKRVKLTLE